ncbi:pantoate--beta-alanine ligase [Mangrovimonas cancribranchiae]|uniref:Pantothenate synthetase n=1 Tax=Mangrovimonas cancribranchiae TaxID=3080055 RepID=A0AAU6NVS4_9FLAO
MKIFYNREEVAYVVKDLKATGKTIGFVPTMGALHEGHLSLIEAALKQNCIVFVSIFVNPTQFNNQEDLKKYPRDLNADVELLSSLSECIYVYAPSVDDIYQEKVASDKFNFNGLDQAMEGRFREGHFNGVATVVKRFFEIITPDNAYFGKKDYQQLLIIKKLVHIAKIPVNIIGCDILRESSGLAMSSRNIRLKPEYKTAAPFIYKTLMSAKEKFGTKSAKVVVEWVENQFEKHELLELEYFTIADAETLLPVKRKSKQKQYRAFIAVYADNIRLIDNIALN